MRSRVELAEYTRRRIPAIAPSAADMRLAERLAGGNEQPRLDVRWLADGDVDIASSSWVGVIRFSNLDVHVVPKLVGGPLRVLRMLEYAAGVSLVKRLPADRPLPVEGTDLFDLICLLLTEEARALLLDGVLRDYRSIDDSIEVLRGRLRYRDQMLRRYGQLHPLECQFDEYDSNTPDNQLVAAALDTARRRANSPEIRSAAMRLASTMASVCEPPTRDAGWYERVIQYNRRNARYRPVHELSKLVLRGIAFDDMYDTSSGEVTAFMIDMNVVFERFVTRLVEQSLDGSGLRCCRQSPLQAAIRDEERGRSYTTIKPDLVIEDGTTGRSVPVDIKYKLYADKKVATSDVYQLFVYAYALAPEGSVRRAGVIYPAMTTVSGPALSVRRPDGGKGALIAGAGIDVPNVLDSLAAPDQRALHSEVVRTISDITGLRPSRGVSPPFVSTSTSVLPSNGDRSGRPRPHHSGRD